MRKDNELLKLVAITVVFATFIIMAISGTLSMTSTREDSFRTEANKVLKASKEAYENKIDITEDTKSCKIDDNRVCYSIDYLIESGIYEADKDTFIGKVIYDNSNESYELYLKKNDEFKIIAGSSTDYQKSGTLTVEEWKEEHSLCECL